MKNEEGVEVNNFREVGGKRKLFFYESDGEMKFWLKKKKWKGILRILDLRVRIHDCWYWSGEDTTFGISSKGELLPSEGK